MNELGERIIRLRKNKGISQERLAETAQISLRTLQRIEKGDNSPHGDTLLRIAKALGSEIGELVDPEYEDNTGFIKAMHLSALIFIFIPTGNILLPLILWMAKKNQVKDLTFYAKKLLNFQITWSLVAYFPFALIFIGVVFQVPIQFPGWFPEWLNSFSIIYFVYFILYPVNAIYLLITGILIKKECRNYFPVAIRFIR